MTRPASWYGLLIVFALGTVFSSRGASQQAVPRFERSACDFEPRR